MSIVSKKRFSRGGKCCKVENISKKLKNNEVFDVVK